MQVNSLLVNAGVYGTMPQPNSSHVALTPVSQNNLLQKSGADSISVSNAAMQKYQALHPVASTQAVPTMSVVTPTTATTSSSWLSSLASSLGL